MTLTRVRIHSSWKWRISCFLVALLSWRPLGNYRPTLGKEREEPLSNLVTKYSSPISLAKAISTAFQLKAMQGGRQLLGSYVFKAWVQECLLRLSSNKNAGPENLQTRYCTSNTRSPSIVGTLKAIFDHSISNKTFPKHRKKDILVPIPKTHPAPVFHNLCTNDAQTVLQVVRVMYKLFTARTIGLAKSFKIFEKFILWEHVWANWTSCNFQHAFRLSASITALLDIATLIWRCKLLGVRLDTASEGMSKLSSIKSLRYFAK